MGMKMCCLKEGGGREGKREGEREKERERGREGEEREREMR